MANPEFRYDLLIRESHLDTFGHVNNAAYLQIFEEARWEIVTANGYGLAEVAKRRQGPVILEVQLKFLKELKLREKITVVSIPVPFSGKVGKIEQRMVKPDGGVACEAVFTVGFFDLAARKLIEPTPEWMRAVGLA